MSDHTFDIVVLGGGSGGYAAAIRASELGKSVALIEKDKVGGTCLHRGCIPTKALLHAAEVAENVRDAASYGVRAQLEGIDVEGVRSYREGIVAKKFKGLEGLLKARGITVVPGEGRLEGGRTVRVGDDTYTGADVILATGSYSRTLPGLEIGGRVLTSEERARADGGARARRHPRRRSDRCRVRERVALLRRGGDDHRGAPAPRAQRGHRA